MCGSDSTKYDWHSCIRENVSKMWHIMNVKSTSAGSRLNDNDRYPIKHPNDSRLKFLGDMATSFKKMDNSVSGHRIRGLTSDTSNALHQTLKGFVELIKTLLLSNFIYIMPGHVVQG